MCVKSCLPDPEPVLLERSGIIKVCWMSASEMVMQHRGNFPPGGIAVVLML
jgi:hypothetical protein